jgi:hypothetical protein
VEEVSIEPAGDYPELFIAIAADLAPDGRINEIRVYYSSWPLPAPAMGPAAGAKDQQLARGLPRGQGRGAELANGRGNTKAGRDPARRTTPRIRQMRVRWNR